MNERFSMQRFTRDALPVVPWKNGGGTTQQIACWPPDAAANGEFGWRVSIATIAADGAFSLFAGVDRSIMLLDGDGVHLRSRDRTVDHRLDVAGQPFCFSGDLALDCSLLGGPSSDLNVMTRRGLWRAEVGVLAGPAASIGAASHGVLFAVRGDWKLNHGEVACREGEGVCWAGAQHVWQAVAAVADARLAVIRIEPAQPAEPDR